MDLIVIGEIIGAIMTILGALCGMYKFIRYFDNKFNSIDGSLKNLEICINDNQKDIKQINKLITDLEYNTIETLRLVIINEDMPLDERLKAGKKYLEMGENGSIRLLIKDLEKQEYLNLHDKNHNTNSIH